jgi:hypothetical protein
MSGCRWVRVCSRIPLAFLTGVLLLAPVLPRAAEDTGCRCLLVNAGVDVRVLPRASVADIFLGNKRHWADGTRIKLAVLKSVQSQKTFLEAATGRSPRQYWSHWRNIVFSGRGLMPKVFASEKELVAYVAEEKGAVGHVASTNLIASSDVKLIRVAQEGDE